jgi:hypothetical protein
MRVFLAVSAALLLFACNWVVTKAPLFSTADEAHAPRLRNGIWAFPSKDGCDFDAHKPITAWPECVDVLIVSGDRWISPDRAGGKKPSTVMNIILASGSPRILQYAQGESTDAGTAGAGYGYYALKATKTDRQGRITAFVTWPVLCGPPPPQTGETQKRSGTLHPFPGMTLDANDDDCTTNSQEDLRNAADASQLLSEQGPPVHWVRDGAS